MWAERQQLIIGQISGADVVALSRFDRLEDSSPDEIRAALRPYCNGIDLLSVHDSDSLEKMMMNVPEFAAP
jgi:G3E family GTPase